MAYHWTDSSPWHAQHRRQQLEHQARRSAAAVGRRAKSLAEANDRVAALEKALEPFAAMATAGDQRPNDDAVWAGQDGKRITYGDFRRARTALEGASDDR